MTAARHTCRCKAMTLIYGCDESTTSRNYESEIQKKEDRNTKNMEYITLQDRVGGGGIEFFPG